MEFGRSTTRFICFELKNSVLMFVLWFASVWKKIFFHWPLAKSLNQGSTAGGRSGVTHPDRGARSAATWIPGGQPPQGLSNVMLISSNHTWLTYGCGKIFWHPFLLPWVKVTKLPKWDRIYLVATVKWESLIQSLQNLVGIFPLPCFPPD